jgi:putative peptide modification system cyclase
MDASEPRPQQPLDTAPVTPMLRAVLLCDIVESTAIIERLGDLRAVALLKRHDQLLRQLMELCHGQLIDKADGVLALFERPIQALDFALRYQRGLRELGALEGLDLKARIGLHVGDVMTWANAPRDVLAGAKAFEVEGLAKPVAARLMNLALPGQILMSGMAQNLCHRAMGELGADATRLRWLMHGRYNFKGVPAPMLVHEVGEPGLSPLRAPDSGAKAWRELPLWRRPPVVALEVLLVGALGLGLFWTAFRSPPAIAFAERDWVVVADLQNRTSEKLLDDSLDMALRIGMEQSQYVNLVAENQIDRALQRMQRPNQPIDRQLATELALREGARAVILPTVADVGGRIRVSLEVIDPQSGVTVFSESADGRGLDSVLGSLDTALVAIRAKLGETISSTQASQPLEEVTTSNLEALKAYSLGFRARSEGRVAEAVSLYEEAVRLDPEFSMAWLRLAFQRYVAQDAAGTRRYLDKALQHGGNLTQRERIFLEGAEATLSRPDVAVEKFRMLANLYPDDYRAHYNFAYFSHFDLLESAQARELVLLAEAPQNPNRFSAAYLGGVLDLALNDYDSAIAQFDKADSFGLSGLRIDHIHAYLALRRYADAARVAALQGSTGSLAVDVLGRAYEVTIPLDRGRWQVAGDAMRALTQTAHSGDATLLTGTSTETMGLLLRAYAPDEAFAGDLRTAADALPARLAAADLLLARHLVFQANAMAWAAAYTGDVVLARKLIGLTEKHPLLAAYAANSAMQQLALAEVDLASGQASAAIDRLAPAVARNEGLYLTRAVLMRAFAAEGKLPEARELAQWLAINRGRALAEPSSLGILQPVNIIEANLALRASGRLAARIGDTAAASEQAAAFAEAWPEGSQLALVKRRDAAF